MGEASSAVFSFTGFVVLSAGLVFALSLIGRPLVAFTVVIVAAVAVEYITLDFALMAGMAAMILLTILLSVLGERRKAMPGEAIRPKTDVDWIFAAYAVIAVIYVAVGLGRGNSPVYALGDFYHVLFEMVLPFFLCMIFLRSRPSFERFNQLLAMSMIVLSIAVLILYATGKIQDFEGGGQAYRRSEVWRLRLSHNYPLIPFVWVAALWLYRTTKAQARVTAIAAILLLAALVLTLKRTAWIATALISGVYFFLADARQRARVVGGVFALVVLGLVAASFFLPREDFQAGSGIEAYSNVVSKRFSRRESDIESSFGNRQSEWNDALRIIANNPFGHGLGSEFRIRNRRTEGLNEVHYVHNVFIHYTLQAGIWYTILFVVLSARAIPKALMLVRRLPDGPLKGAVFAALGAYIAIFVSSMTELSIHTFFFPYAVATIYSAEHIARREGLLATKRDALVERDVRVGASLPD